MTGLRASIAAIAAATLAMAGSAAAQSYPDRIIEMVEAERNKKNLIVVTSDRKLADRVRVCGVRVMRSGEFRRMLEDARGGATPSESQVKDEEAGEWLRYFGVDEADEEA